jgi:hypothetical protein
MLLCQLVVGEKLGTDPVARRLFDNLLAYCDSYRPVRRRTVAAMDPSRPAFRLLAAAGLECDLALEPLAALADPRAEIVVLDASAANLKALAGRRDAVEAFTGRGGWLFAWGLEPEGLADFDRLVGVEHILRPFELERVALATPRDPLLSGITARDVTMESSEKIFPWAGDRYLVDDAFTWIVDLDDIAPFCEFPGSKAGDRAAAREAVANWPRNAVNGFTSADAWKLIHYLPTSSPRLEMRLPREETVERLSIVLNTHYAVPTRLRVAFDDDPSPLEIPVRADGSRQDLDLAPRKARKIAIELAGFDKRSPTTGIDNLWLRVRRAPEWRARVKPLLATGGLVKYPMGKGGLVLVQLNAKDSEAEPENLQKKRAIAAALLRNLGATFAGGKLLTAADLDFAPLPLGDRLNAYLTRDRGWFEGSRDLGHLPLGDIRLGGVRYVIRDFKTSPVPGCVMLAGPGARGKLPEEVKGLPAGVRADVLFFLHTFHQTAEWRGRKPDERPPVVFRSIVHYADGATAEAPVTYGEGAGHWISRDPAGLRSASVAWAAPFPGDAGGEQAVVYQFAWTNPRPDAEIASIDLAFGPQGKEYGTPALIAITAGKRAR